MFSYFSRLSGLVTMNINLTNVKVDLLVKTVNVSWLSKKTFKYEMRKNFYDFGVL